MDWDIALKLISAGLLSIGSASIIIIGLSSWLGKIWAQRILEKEKSALQKEVESTKNELEIFKQKILSSHNDKIAIYRMAVDTVSEILAAFDLHFESKLGPTDAQKALDDFNKQRMRVYGYLAMLAPQSVMDAQDMLMDKLLLIAYGKAQYEWSEVRDLALNLINAVRTDVGIDKSVITYNGEL